MCNTDNYEEIDFMKDKKYVEQLRHMRGPYVDKKLGPVRMDLSGLSRYLCEKEVKPWELSEEEVERFLPDQPPLPPAEYLIEEHFREIAMTGELKSPGTVDVAVECYSNTPLPRSDMHRIPEGSEEVETEGVSIYRRSFLYKYSMESGWGADWEEYLIGYTILAVVLWGTTDVQGFVAVRKDNASQTVRIAEMHVASWNKVPQPDSNKHHYAGIGTMLFHLAAEWAAQNAPGWPIVGKAATPVIAEHYCDVLGAKLTGGGDGTEFSIEGKMINRLRVRVDCELTNASL